MAGLPPITFAVWYPWPGRDQVPCLREPGVYLLAFGVGSGELVNALDERIIYIGQTCESFRKRWGQFQRQITRGKGSHSGGVSFRARCSGRSPEELFVAPWAPRVPEKQLREAYIRYAERKLILDWVVRHGKLPLCNSS
jgi:hypothetical protein